MDQRRRHFGLIWWDGLLVNIKVQMSSSSILDTGGRMIKLPKGEFVITSIVFPVTGVLKIRKYLEGY
jgi:hypothetical protein